MRKANPKPLRTYGRHRKRRISLVSNQSISKLSFLLENESNENLFEGGLHIDTKGNSSGTAFDRLLKESNNVYSRPRRTNLWISSNSSQSSESSRGDDLFKSPEEKKSFKSSTRSPINLRKKKTTRPCKVISSNFQKKRVVKLNLAKTDVEQGKLKAKKARFYCGQKHNTRSVNWSDIEKYSFVIDQNRKECNDSVSKPQMCLFNYGNTNNPHIAVANYHVICDITAHDADCVNSHDNRLDNTTNNEDFAYNDKYKSDIIASNVDRHSSLESIPVTKIENSAVCNDFAESSHLENQNLPDSSQKVLEYQGLQENRLDNTTNNEDCASIDNYKSDTIASDVDKHSFSEPIPVITIQDSPICNDFAEKSYLENQNLTVGSPEVLKTRFSCSSPSPLVAYSQKFLETDKIITSTPFVLPAAPKLNCFDEEWSYLNQKENSDVLYRSSLKRASTNRCNSGGNFNHIKLALNKIVDQNHHQTYTLPVVNNHFEMSRRNTTSKNISCSNSESLFKLSYISKSNIKDIVQKKFSEYHNNIDVQKSLSNISANESSVDANSKSSYDLFLPTPKPASKFKTRVISHLSSGILSHYENCNKDASFLASNICNLDSSKQLSDTSQLSWEKNEMAKTSHRNIGDPSMKSVAFSYSRRNLSVFNEFNDLPSFSGFGSSTVEDSRKKRIQRYRDLCKSFVIALSPLPLHFIGQSGEVSTTPEEKVLAHCSQEEPISFSKAFDSKVLSTSEKIGEGVYGEVFRIFYKNGTKAALKIIPVEGNFPVNGETQKNFNEILPEIVISQELGILNEGLYNTTTNFIKVSKVSCIKGKYPRKLLQEWDKYNRKKESQNDRPDMFGPNQIFIAFESADGGIDLETFQLQNAVQATSIFTQVACTLAVSEQALKFEHRDLHWGNILVSECDSETIEYTLNGEKFAILSCGVFVSIIDFTLSRLSKDGCIVFTDLFQEPTLFTGEGDYQFDIYRLMKEHNNNDWESFRPYSNVLWLHYLIVKMCTGKKYKNGISKCHQAGMKQLKMWRENILQYESATDFVRNSGIISQSIKSIRNIENPSESKETLKAPKASNRVTRLKVKKNISLSLTKIDKNVKTKATVTIAGRQNMNSKERCASKVFQKEKEKREGRITRSCIKKSKGNAESFSLLRLNVRI